jgi:hypothetical protein
MKYNNKTQSEASLDIPGLLLPGLLSHRHFCTLIFQPLRLTGSGHVILREMPCIHK